MAAKTHFPFLHNDDFDEIAYNDAQVEAELNRQYEEHCAAQLEKEQDDAQAKIREALQISTEIEAASTDKPPYIPHAYVPRENKGGNFCGHQRLKPSFVLTINPYDTDEETDQLGDKRRSAILYDIVARIRDYYHNPDTISAFNIANSDKRKTDRQRNSSRREALVNLCSVMVMNMDLATLRVGFPSAKGFVSRPIKWLADKANLSISRTKRAMSDLNHSGILSSFQRRELLDADSKTYQFHVAARAFSSAFFIALGINPKKLSASRQWASKNADNKAFNSPKAQAEQQLIINRIQNHLGRSAKKANGLQDEAAAGKQNRDAKKRTQMVIDLLQQYPELRDNAQALNAAIEQQLCVEGLARNNE